MRLGLKTLSRRAALSLLGAAPLAACVSSSPRLHGPIHREEFVSIGGIDQFVAIHGRAADNPALLFVHGGPGNAMSPFLQVFAPWEENFTVINWDQRGSGQTFGRNPSETANITPERITPDAIEVAEHACRTLDKRKLVLCGHSMGALLGWRMIQARPDLFHAFIGTGGLYNYERTLLMQEAHARAKAEAAGDAAALKAMTEAQRLPVNDIRRPGPIRRWLVTGPDDIAYLEKTQQPFVSQAAASPAAQAWVGGQRRTTAAGSPMLAFMLNYDIAKEGFSSRIPVMVIQGRDDRIAPAQPAREFVDAVTAPTKRFNEISGGHFACFTNPDEFLPPLRAFAGGFR